MAPQLLWVGAAEGDVLEAVEVVEVGAAEPLTMLAHQSCSGMESCQVWDTLTALSQV